MESTCTQQGNTWSLTSLSLQYSSISSWHTCKVTQRMSDARSTGHRRDERTRGAQPAPARQPIANCSRNRGQADRRSRRDAAEASGPCQAWIRFGGHTEDGGAPAKTRHALADLERRAELLAREILADGVNGRGAAGRVLPPQREPRDACTARQTERTHNAQAWSKHTRESMRRHVQTGRESPR
jgi:hypothetical protein